MKTSLALVFAILCIQLSEAQGILERINKKAQQKIEERIENKVDKKIDKELDNLENKTTPSEDKERKSALEQLSKMTVSGEPVKYQDTYSFNESVTMNMTMYNKKNEMKQVSKITLYFTPSEMNFGYRLTNTEQKKKKDDPGMSFFVFDKNNDAMLMLGENENGKTGIATGIKVSDKDTDDDNNKDDFKFTKTGRTKTILGYKCDEWVGQSADSKAVYWVTSDIKWQSGSFMNNLSNKKGKTITDYPEGMMLEGDFTSSDGERINYLVTDIDHNANFKINISEYQISNLGSISF
jgi:hypothetical protein